MRISDWSSDVCSSDLLEGDAFLRGAEAGDLRQACEVHGREIELGGTVEQQAGASRCFLQQLADRAFPRSEEHTSELQSLMRISYAVFCLKKKKRKTKHLKQDPIYATAKKAINAN